MHFHEPDARSCGLRAKCRLKSGMVAEVQVLDLSIAGCMIAREAIALAEDDRVLMRLPGLEYMPSKVLWAEDGRVGIEFERDLHDAVYDRFIAVIRGPARAA